MAVRFEGLDEVLGSIEHLADTQQMEQAMGQACAIVVAAAVPKAPKDTGALRRSIAYKVTNEGGNIEGVVYTPLEYAPYIEYGTGLFAEESGRKDVPWNYQDDKGKWHSTSGIKPQPFMRPALNENREKIKQKLKEGFSSD